jgi:hypothetical protein
VRVSRAECVTNRLPLNARNCLCWLACQLIQRASPQRHLRLCITRPLTRPRAKNVPWAGHVDATLRCLSRVLLAVVRSGRSGHPKQLTLIGDERISLCTRSEGTKAQFAESEDATGSEPPFWLARRSGETRHKNLSSFFLTLHDSCSDVVGAEAKLSSLDYRLQSPSSLARQNGLSVAQAHLASTSRSSSPMQLLTAV